MTKRRVVCRSKRYLSGFLFIGLVVLFTGASRSQDQKQSTVAVKKVPVNPTTEVQGDLLYRHHCATCHGAAGKGDGPAAPALRTAPPDLTVLAKNNNGKFPDLRVMRVLESGAGVTAHGSKEMPIWGPIFLSMGPAGAGGQIGRLREANLIDYLKSIQGR